MPEFLHGSLTKSDELSSGDKAQGQGIEPARFFEGQKSYVVLLDSDNNGVADQITDAYSLIYTVPEATPAGPVHSGVGMLDPKAVIVKTEKDVNVGSSKNKHYHFEGTITIPNVKIKQGSRMGQEVTVQFAESKFEFPFLEEGFSRNRVHNVKEDWVPGRIVPPEQSPKAPVVDGYLYLDE